MELRYQLVWMWSDCSRIEGYMGALSKAELQSRVQKLVGLSELTLKVRGLWQGFTLCCD